eukprot:1338751-Amorphochlora_amoeboformis.AAC.2
MALNIHLIFSVDTQIFKYGYVEFPVSIPCKQWFHEHQAVPRKEQDYAGGSKEGKGRPEGNGEIRGASAAAQGFPAKLGRIRSG